jgi:hypothetical protein
LSSMSTLPVCILDGRSLLRLGMPGAGSGPKSARLYRAVPEEKLDLIQFAAGEVAQPGTGSSQIVRRQLRDAGFGGRMA